MKQKWYNRPIGNLWGGVWIGFVAGFHTFWVSIIIVGIYMSIRGANSAMDGLAQPQNIKYTVDSETKTDERTIVIIKEKIHVPE